MVALPHLGLTGETTVQIGGVTVSRRTDTPSA